MIYHGYTLTSKIKFRSVVQAIAEHAFACSPYPLILSLENHCSLSQQKKMARYMKDSFGEMLLTCEDEDIVTTNLPSPEVCFDTSLHVVWAMNLNFPVGVET